MHYQSKNHFKIKLKSKGNSPRNKIKLKIRSKQKSKWILLWPRAATTMILCGRDCMSYHAFCPFTEVVKLFWSWVILEEFFSNSMSDFRVAFWKNNTNLKEALLKYVGRGLQRREMLDFLTRDFPLYAWSVRMLDRKLRHLTYFSMMVLL